VQLAALVAKSRSYQLTPEGKLISRHDPAPGLNGIDRVRSLLQTLRPMHSAS